MHDSVLFGLGGLVLGALSTYAYMSVYLRKKDTVYREVANLLIEKQGENKRVMTALSEAKAILGVREKEIKDLRQDLFVQFEKATKLEESQKTHQDLIQDAFEKLKFEIDKLNQEMIEFKVGTNLRFEEYKGKLSQVLQNQTRLK